MTEEEKEGKDCPCDCECDCECDCDCECCRHGKHREEKVEGSNNPITHFSVNDTVGAAFLGILAVMLLVFLVRSNKRNRELLLEVIELRRQT